jgi:hypothetical protein
MNIVDTAKANLSKAYVELGHEPGPGLDLILLPELPVAHWYSVKCLTLAGASFMKLLYNSEGRVSHSSLTKLKKEAAEFGLSFHTDWSNVVEVVR